MEDGPEHDHRLSCAAVGLWYPIRAAQGNGSVSGLELMTLVADPTAWHPEGSLESLDRPLDELMAIGWVVQDEAGLRAGWMDD